MLNEKLERRLEVYINNIDIRGRNVGGWIELPYYDLEEQLQELGVDTDREYMIYDIDNYIGLNLNDYMGYYIDLAGLNELMETVADMEDSTFIDFKILADYHGVKDALEIIEKEDYYIIHDITNIYDLSYRLMEDYYPDIPEEVKTYIDHRKMVKENVEEYNSARGYAIVYSDL